MKHHYYPEADNLYNELKLTAGVETREIVDGLNVDLDANGAAVGLDFEHAYRLLDFTTSETISLPLT